MNASMKNGLYFVSFSIPVTIVSDPEGDTDNVECVELGLTNINLREVIIIIIIAIVARNHSNNTVNITPFCGQL